MSFVISYIVDNNLMFRVCVCLYEGVMWCGNVIINDSIILKLFVFVIDSWEIL